MASEKAVILMSGGLNSAVAAALASMDHSPAALHVRIGHRAAAREAELFAKQADQFRIRERQVIDMPHFAAIGGNARVMQKRPADDAPDSKENEANCHVPGLIGSLILAAFTWAKKINATKIFIGVCEDLGPAGPKTCVAFPDYSREFLQLCNHQLAVASPGKPVSVEAPLIDLPRGEIVKLGRRMETPFELTWSCLMSGEECCGTCPGCATRHRGFLDAAIPDPILLQPVTR